MELSTCLEGQSLETLVDGVVGCPSLHNTVGNAFGTGLGDGIVGMNQIHRVKGGGLERSGVQTPSRKLVKKIIVHAPILKGLKITVKPRPRISTDIVNMNLFSSLSEHDGGGQTGQSCAHDVNGFGYWSGVGHGWPWRREV